MPTISSPQAEQRCTTTAFKTLTTRPPKSSTCSGFNILSIHPLHLQRKRTLTSVRGQTRPILGCHFRLSAQGTSDPGPDCSPSPEASRKTLPSREFEEQRGGWCE